jgi:glycosyltransferase involved in cell wall biosynthesis
MRLLQVTNTYYPEVKFGGPPLKIHAISKGLIARGHEVEVVTFHSEEPGASRREVVDGVPVQYVPWAGYGLRQYPRDVSLITRAVADADVVHCYGLYSILCPVAARQARRAKKPFLLELLGHYPPRARNVGVKKIYNWLVTSRMVRQAACVVVTSPNELKETAELTGQTPAVVRRNGIDLSLFKQMPAPEIARRKLNIGEHTRVILYVGRIAPIKNLLALVAAFRDAAVKDAILVFVGPTLERDYEMQLRAFVEEQKLTERVIFAGSLFGEEKLSALAAAELFVLPSLNESFGNAAAEAVAAGVPVVITESCGIAPMIHERAGLMVPLSIEGLTKGIKVMMDDLSVRERMTSRRAEVIRALSWEEPIEQTERLYLDILAGKEADCELART